MNPVPHQPNCSMLKQNWLWTGFRLRNKKKNKLKCAEGSWRGGEVNKYINQRFGVLQCTVSHSSPQDRRTLNSTLSRFLQLLLTAFPFVWEVARPWSARRNTKAPQHQLFSPASHSHAAFNSPSFVPLEIKGLTRFSPVMWRARWHIWIMSADIICVGFACGCFYIVVNIWTYVYNRQMWCYMTNGEEIKLWQIESYQYWQ